MPTYEYLCENCGHKMEKFQSITANPIKKCPECGKPKLKRLIGAGAGLIFKGSGFYETDYRKSDYKQKQKQEKESKSESQNKSESGKSSKDNSAKSEGGKKKSSPKSSDKKSDKKTA